MQLKIFADEETGASHRQLDNPTIGRQFIFDWLKDQLRLGEPLGCSPFRRQMLDQHAADGVTPGPRIPGSAIRGTDVGTGVRLARIQLKLRSCLLHPPPDYRERLGHVPQSLAAKIGKYRIVQLLAPGGELGNPSSTGLFRSGTSRPRGHRRETRCETQSLIFPGAWSWQLRTAGAH